MKKDKDSSRWNIPVRIFEILTFPWRALPLRVHYFLGRILAWFLKHVYHYRRDDVMINISRCFPDKDYKEIVRLTDAFYDHFAMILAETLWFGGSNLHKGRVRKSGIVRITNPEVVAKPLEEGRSIMVLGSHLGNWELIGGFLEYVDLDLLESLPVNEDNVVVVYKKLESAFFDRFMRDNRTMLFKDFPGYVESGDVIPYAFSHRHDPKIYIFFTDQFPYRIATKHVLPKPFMHQKTLVMTGGAALAKKFGMAVWYMNVDRIRRGHYEITLKPITDNASGSTPEAVMEKFYDYLGEDLEANPTNYLWSHKRWKIRKQYADLFNKQNNDQNEK